MPHDSLPIAASSYLESAFVRWVLTPAVTPAIIPRIVPQSAVTVDDRAYRIDYEIVGESVRLAVELDGYAFHSARSAFTYDRLRQNDLMASGRYVLRFSYDAIRLDTARCVAQLQAALRLDSVLATYIDTAPLIEPPTWNQTPSTPYNRFRNTHQR